MDNKSFVTRLARLTNHDAKTINTLVSAFTRVLGDRAAELDSVAVPGFGVFAAGKKREDVVEDPDTGHRMLLPPKISIDFVAATALKKRLARQ